MPLSKAKMRERKRKERVKPASNLNSGGNVKPKSSDNWKLATLDEVNEILESKGLKPLAKVPPIGHGLPLGKDRQSRGFDR